jgi:DNA repair exonuclease SbcCD nuclease subunit
MEIDTYERLDIGFDTVKCVVHLADIHIRLTKRHDEYRQAFDKIYSGVKKTPPNTLIVVAGDLMHSKVDLSPEAVQLASEFLKNIADIRPTILIAGNHDCLLTNATRLDSLSPIVDNLAHDKLFYLKESKLYGAGNVLFNNMSIFDDVTKYIEMKNVVKSIKLKFDCKVALFHGAVNEAKTGIGYNIQNKVITTALFDGHDIAMLGDIHLPQIMNIEKTISENEIENVNFNEWEIIEEFDKIP